MGVSEEKTSGVDFLLSLSGMFSSGGLHNQESTADKDIEKAILRKHGMADEQTVD